MSSHDDFEYFRARAEQEREAAQDASKQHVAEIHLELANAYEALMEHPMIRPRIRRAV